MKASRRNEEATELTTYSVPLLLETVKRGKKSKVPKNVALSNILDKAHSLGGFTIGKCGYRTSSEVSMSWMVDSGTEVAQISLKAAEQYWESLIPLGHDVVICRSAHNNNRIEMQYYCVLKQLCLYDPFTGAVTAMYDIIVFINNPKLNVHDCVLGKHSINVFDLRIHIHDSVMWDTYGCEILRLLTNAEEKTWKRQGILRSQEPSIREVRESHSVKKRSDNTPRTHRAAQTPKPKDKGARAASISKSKTSEAHTKSPTQLRYTPLFADEPNRKIEVTVTNEMRTPEKMPGTSWSLHRYRNRPEDPRYTPKDKEELRHAKEVIKAEAEEEERLQERIANVAISASLGEMSDESPPMYQPCRRLIRVDELDPEGSRESLDSMLGVHHPIFYSESSSVKNEQRSPSPDAMDELFQHKKTVTSAQIRASIRARTENALKTHATPAHVHTSSVGAVSKRSEDRNSSVGSVTSEVLFEQTKQLFNTPPEKPQGVNVFNKSDKRAISIE